MISQSHVCAYADVLTMKTSHKNVSLTKILDTQTIFFFGKENQGVGEMAQWLEALTALPEDPWLNALDSHDGTQSSVTRFTFF